MVYLRKVLSFFCAISGYQLVLNDLRRVLLPAAPRQERATAALAAGGLLEGAARGHAALPPSDPALARLDHALATACAQAAAAAAHLEHPATQPGGFPPLGRPAALGAIRLETPPAHLQGFWPLHAGPAADEQAARLESPSAYVEGVPPRTGPVPGEAAHVGSAGFLGSGGAAARGWSGSQAGAAASGADADGVRLWRGAAALACLEAFQVRRSPRRALWVRPIRLAAE